MAAQHVVALVGSLRDASFTRTAAARALTGAENAGATTELLDLRAFDLPPLNPDQNTQGDSQQFIETVRQADALILASPMYHGSYSGVLKNALDYCGFEEFEKKNGWTACGFRRLVSDYDTRASPIGLSCTQRMGASPSGSGSKRSQRL